MSASSHPPVFDAFLCRATDIAVSLVLLPIIAIPMAAVSIAILLEDGSPILFRQTRVGRGTKTFSILKFRTMYNDPERTTGEVDATTDISAARAQFQTASRHDPRVTRTGRLLRMTHIDELPQLFNVLKGDMSLVGVRPDVPVQKADYTEAEWEERHLLLPGITGMAQVDAEAIEFREVRKKFDLTWVRSFSYVTYIKVLFATIVKVVDRSGV